MNSSLTPSVSFSTSFTRQANGDNMIVALDEEYRNVIFINDSEGFGWPEDVPEDLVKDYFKVMKEFERVQKKLWKIYIDGDKKNNE